MRLITIRNVAGGLALGALIVYTMRLPEHQKAQPPAPKIAAIPAPPVAASTLIAGPAIGANNVPLPIPLPVTPASRSHIIDRCFTADTDLNAPVIWGPNAVITAALKSEWEIVKKLIDAGASVQSSDETGLTPLMVAAQQGNIEMLRTLLERQARIDFMDFEGRTALQYAMAAEKRDAVELLLSLSPGFDPGSP